MIQREQRIRLPNDRVEARKVPIPHALIQSTTTPQVIYTVQDNASIIIRQFAVSNSNGVTGVPFTLYSVPVGETAGAANAELVSFNVPSQSAVDLTPIIGGFYEAGTVISAFAGVAGDLNFHGWAEEVL